MSTRTATLFSVALALICYFPLTCEYNLFSLSYRIRRSDTLQTSMSKVWRRKYLSTTPRQSVVPRQGYNSRRMTSTLPYKVYSPLSILYALYLCQDEGIWFHNTVTQLSRPTTLWPNTCLHNISCTVPYWISYVHQLILILFQLFWQDQYIKRRGVKKTNVIWKLETATEPKSLFFA